MDATTSEQMALVAIHKILDSGVTDPVSVLCGAADAMYDAPGCMLTHDMCTWFVDRRFTTAVLGDTRVGDNSTVTINNVEYPIPHHADLRGGGQSKVGYHRTIAAIRAAGYRPFGAGWSFPDERWAVLAVRQLPKE